MWGKIEFIDVDALFDVDSFNENVTFEDFIKSRKEENILIEEYILKERREK